MIRDLREARTANTKNNRDQQTQQQPHSTTMIMTQHIVWVY